MQRQYGRDTFGIIVEGISTTTRQISLTGLKEGHGLLDKRSPVFLRFVNPNSCLNPCSFWKADDRWMKFELEYESEEVSIFFFFSSFSILRRRKKTRDAKKELQGSPREPLISHSICRLG